MIAKGWLRASNRAIRSREPGLLHQHDRHKALVPGERYELEIGLTPAAHCIRAGSRLRLDVSCTDSLITDAVFTHALNPDDVGADTIHFGWDTSSVLTLTMLPQT